MTVPVQWSPNDSANWPRTGCHEVELFYTLARMKSPQEVNSASFTYHIRIQMGVRINSRLQRDYCQGSDLLWEKQVQLQVLSEAMGDALWEHLPHSGEHSLYWRAGMEICVHAFKREQKPTLCILLAVSAWFLEQYFNKEIRPITLCTDCVQNCVQFCRVYPHVLK